jgi:hypothetical protein
MGNRAVLPRNVRLIVLGLCAGLSSSVLAQHADTSATQVAKSRYAVEDLVLDDKVDPDTVTSRTYHCSPSEQFTGFTWCSSRSSKGRVRSSYSILHGTDDKSSTPTRPGNPHFLRPQRRKTKFKRFRKRLVGSQRLSRCRINLHWETASLLYGAMLFLHLLIQAT